MTPGFPFMRAVLLPVTASAVLLAGCASFTGIAPTAKQTSEVAITTPAGIKGAQDAWPEHNWWSAYGDPQLDKLIRHALENSPTLATAQTRIAKAQAAVNLNRSATAPQVDAALQANRGRQSENFLYPTPPLGPGGEIITQATTTVNFAYDLDFWGKNGNLIRSAEAQLKAANFDRDAAELALTTSIARTYAQLAAQYDLQDILLETQKQRAEISKLTKQRVASGLDTRVELKQNETNEASIRLDLEQVATQIDVTRLQLAALMGDMPTAAQSIARPKLANVPFTIPGNLPLNLLGRRAELAAQRERIIAATGDVDAAKAEFYPNISLTGFAGYQSIGLDNLLKASSLVTSLGPAISIPIFHGGRIRANYAMKTADLDSAITQYNQSVVTAAQDVAEQLTRAASLAREDAAVREALAAAEEAYRLAMLRYRGGLSPYLTVLTVETQLLAQRRAAVDVRSRQQDVHIALVRALGGGFTDSADSATNNTQQ
jgi:NodT family efflux transporter outer membrane factor (OMF) lipoprotein